MWKKKLKIFYRNTSFVKDSDIETIIEDIERNDYDIVILLGVLKKFENDYEFPSSATYTVYHNKKLNGEVLIFVKKTLDCELLFQSEFIVTLCVNNYSICSFYNPFQKEILSLHKNLKFLEFLDSLKKSCECSKDKKIVLIGDINLPFEYENGSISIWRPSAGSINSKSFNQLRFVSRHKFCST